MKTAELTESFQVATWVHVLGGFVSRNPGLWRRLGNIETGVLAGEMDGIDIREPVYVTGLARSGSTLLLEVLNRHPDLTSHRYRDYPLLFTPYLWNRYLDRAPQKTAHSRERTHRDGIFITPESPEAFEEILWMAFFDNLHDPGRPAVLDADTHDEAFERFYRDHIRKLLLVRGGRRYLAKNNYNITRLPYLLRMFEDARFVIPIREPVWHIASLMKQHRRFCRGQRLSPRALTHLRRIGHFEFGLDRRPINPGDNGRIGQILRLWEDGAEIEGCAQYWALIHDYLADELASRPQLRAAVRLVRYEDFCRDPVEGVHALFEHCRLPVDETLIAAAAERIRPPDATIPEMFSPDDLTVIERCTATSAGRFGLGRYS